MDCASLFDMLPMCTEMDGPSAARALRALRFDGPIIGVTGNVIPSDVEFFVARGATAVFGKPMRMDKMKALFDGEIV